MRGPRRTDVVVPRPRQDFRAFRQTPYLHVLLHKQRKLHAMRSQRRPHWVRRKQQRRVPLGRVRRNVGVKLAHKGTRPLILVHALNPHEPLPHPPHVGSHAPRKHPRIPRGAQRPCRRVHRPTQRFRYACIDAHDGEAHHGHSPRNATVANARVGTASFFSSVAAW